VAKAYGDKVQQIAHELKCPVVDTWDLLQGSTDDRKQYLSDGVHLNEPGNRRVFEGLMAVIANEFPELAPMDDADGEGKYGTSGIPVEEKLWKELCGVE
jgi:hypothetical protein